MTLDDAIQTVIAARQEYRTVHTQIQQLREAWEVEHAALLQAAALSRDAMRQAETALRSLAIDLYQATGNKSLAPGVKVREVTRLHYDPQAALTWAMEHRMALKLDEKTFEQLARVTAFPFVTRTVEPQATLTPCFAEETVSSQEVPHGDA